MMVRDRRPAFIGFCAVAALLLLAALYHVSGAHSVKPWAFRHPGQSHGEYTALKQGSDYNDDDSEVQSSQLQSTLEGDSDESEGHTGKWAYVTFLACKEDDKPEDPYFTAARTLTYQLLHHPKTKTNRNIPLVILVPSYLGRRKLDILTDEGATIVEIDPMELPDDWQPESGLRASVEFSKLRMWEMKQYDRILYIDSATLVTRCLDDIWDADFVSADMRTLGKIEASGGDKEDLPSKYFMMGVSDTGDSKHPFPPKETTWMGDGFFMLKPNRRLFWYYESLLKNPGKFDMNRYLAGLLNYAHRPDGPQPWKSFKPGKWSVNYPGPQDLEGQVATMHTKFWEKANREWLSEQLVEKWWRIQGQMEGFWLRRGYGAPKTFD
ncbi:nucleotide-diphospho-sugar transferase [Rhizodiscina lignyota]|uniref:Nucleotide-diphospho-sugar transferase n=1 Tax=Rhizodiscina lignyota TaxID=1504668 RepID=A0A9P4IRX6_9PEZI|nr:nucleotide-diphospho-sugar transferase [Rhizodiscina lignyota]